MRLLPLALLLLAVPARADCPEPEQAAKMRLGTVYADCQVAMAVARDRLRKLQAGEVEGAHADDFAAAVDAYDLLLQACLSDRIAA